VGPFDYEFPNGSRPILHMQITRYDIAEVYAFNRSYNFNSKIITGTVYVCSVYVCSMCVCVACVRACVCTSCVHCTITCVVSY